MTKRIKLFVFVLTMVLTAAISASGACAAWNAADEVRRLDKEAPSIDGFKGASALQWLSDRTFRLLADGSMEEDSHQIVMMGETIPSEWKERKIPVRGDVKITDAAWYNPMTGLKEGDLSVTQETLSGGAKVFIVRTPSGAVGRAVVLSVRETYRRSQGIGETIYMAGPLPVWEQNVTAVVPEGMDLFWSAMEIKDPVVTTAAGVKSYKWTVMNQERWLGRGFLVYKRPWLSFSAKKGVVQNLKDANEIAASVPDLPLPAEAAGGKKGAQKLMEWLSDPRTTLEGYPHGWVRPASQIPPRGPWTPWEKTLLLSRWLNKLGWKSEVWWQALTAMDEDSPASDNIWVAPVLEVSNGGKGVLCEAGQASEFGKTSPSIAGSDIYRLIGDKPHKRTVKAGSPSDHKLDLLWVLRLNDKGSAAGRLTASVTGAWTDLFSDGSMPSLNGLSEFLRTRINFAIPAMTLTPVSVKPDGSGYKMEFDVKCTPAILNGGDLLLRLPGGIPSSVGEMIDQQTDYTFRFPFTIVQRVRMDMPGGYRMLQEPPVRKLGAGTKALLNESIIHWPKKAQLVADSVWTVKLLEVSGDYAKLLKEELNACLRWPVINIPFRKR